MKKLFLVLALCVMVGLTGCFSKKKEPTVPKSVATYQQINLTQEQNKKLADIRAKQRVRMEAIRKEMETTRKALLDEAVMEKLTPEQKKANLDKYREASLKMREKITAERAAYDKAFGEILDADQQKTYQKYLKQREDERAEREKEIQKRMKK